MVRYRQQSLLSLGERVRRSFRRLLGRQAPVNDSYLVTLGEQKWKRIVFPSDAQATSVSESLRRFRDAEIFPTVVDHYANELWVEFVEGEAMSEATDDLVEASARILATLYAAEPRRVSLEAWGTDRRVRDDLRFLARAGVVTEAECVRLGAVAEQLAPEEIWIGYDYTDLLPKNFVRTREGRYVLVDVASLGRDRIVGHGLAKALVRWLRPHRDAVLASLASQPIPDFLPYLPWIELAFVTRWSRRAILRGRGHKVKPQHLTRFLDLDT